jgi:FlaA1/EpsC-like NDP-sugar epimerase
MRNRFILLLDFVLIAVAAFGAFALRFDWLFVEYRPEFLSFLIAGLLLKPLLLFYFGMYSRYWRYATAKDLLAVTLAVSAASVVMAVYVGLGRAFDIVETFSRPVLLIDWLLSLVLIGGLRMSVRVVGEAHQKAQKSASGIASKRVLVAGAGEAGTMVVRELERNPQVGLIPVGFLDDAPSKQGQWISDVRVLGRLDDVTRCVAAHAIDQVIIAMPAAGGAIVRSLIETCGQAGVESRIVPGVFELLDGKMSVSRLRHVEITDLLRRPQIVGGFDASGYVTGQTVLLTGGGGSIGSELCRQVAHLSPSRLVMLGHGENSLFEASTQIRLAFPQLQVDVVVADIRDRQRLGAVFASFHPEIVFHAAAHKHVHLMEGNFEEAISNNVVGTYNLVEAALAAGTKRLVAISTDKAVSPNGIMGASKRMSSLIVREFGRRTGRCCVAVRFGNVLGSRGSIVPLFKEQIERGGPITITHPDMKRFFMTIPEAVHLVLQAGGMGTTGELFVLKMGDPVRIVNLAQDLIRLSGLTVDQIPIMTTGIRPGEKLEELLWESDAVIEPTIHSEILKVVEPQVPMDDLHAIVEALARAARDGDRLRAEAILCDYIPTFTPSVASIERQVKPR